MHELPSELFIEHGGVSDTIIWNSITNGANLQPAAVHNLLYTNTPGAIGTVIGND